jgi:thiamine biosynthesis lipoprotein
MNFSIWGLTGSLNTEHEEQMAYAQERLWFWINAVDAACNRFDPSSEISTLNAAGAGTYSISDTLELALDGALRAAHMTNGLCDPTVLPALLALGYDCDYDELQQRDVTTARTLVKPLGLGAVALDREHHTVTLSPLCQLDLGASAKAMVADLVATDVGESGGVVVEIGGDVAVRAKNGPEPWAIGIGETLVASGHEPRVCLENGGIATSSTTTRTWRIGSQLANHIVDPRTGSFATGIYAVATVSAESCLSANAFATAALLWGKDAGYHIAQAGWSARLVQHGGAVEFVGGWPPDDGHS